MELIKRMWYAVAAILFGASAAHGQEVSDERALLVFYSIVAGTAHDDPATARDLVLEAGVAEDEADRVVTFAGEVVRNMASRRSGLISAICDPDSHSGAPEVTAMVDAEKAAFDQVINDHTMALEGRLGNAHATHQIAAFVDDKIKPTINVGEISPATASRRDPNALVRLCAAQADVNEGGYDYVDIREITE